MIFLRYVKKNKNNHKSLFKYQTARHLFCDEMDIWNINLDLFKLICEVIMTIKPLYSEERTFPNHSHTFITGNHELRLKADKGCLRRGLLVETKKTNLLKNKITINFH